MSIDINKEFGHIKPLVSEDTTAEQLYIFLRMCDNEHTMTSSDDFLRQFAEHINDRPIPLIKDTWTADGQVGRVYVQRIRRRE